MLITSVDNRKMNFNGIHLYHISKKSKTGQDLLQASKLPQIASEIAALENKGMIFDFVRCFDHEAKKTDSVAFYLSRKPRYFTENGVNPLYTEAKVTNLDEAKAFLSTIVKKAKDFLPEHIKNIEKYNKLNRN